MIAGTGLPTRGARLAALLACIALLPVTALAQPVPDAERDSSPTDADAWDPDGPPLGGSLELAQAELPASTAPAQPGAPAPAAELTQTDIPAQAPASASAAEAAPASAPAGPGPAIELAESEPPATPAAQAEGPSLHIGVDAGEERVLSRGLQPARLAQSGTVIGGYGQFTLTSLKVGPDRDAETRANVRRLVLFVSHELSDDVHFYSELEWENAMACRDCDGAVEVEQAFVDWKLLDDALVLRAGLVLVPMGILNQWHEPPVFNGVERASTELSIIPTTWRELGIGITGTLADTYRYELYLTTTLDPTALGADGLIAARRQGSLAPAEAFAITGRFEAEPLLGVIAGLGFFASDLGGNADFYHPSGRNWDLGLPLLGYAVDIRARRWGFEARGLWSQFFLPNSADLIRAAHRDGTPYFPNAAENQALPERIEGGYIELGYDVLHELHSGHALIAFVRFETYDTQAAIPDGYAKNRLLDVDEFTGGLNYRPIPQLTFKADLQLRDRKRGLDELQLNAGLGYMF